jgi:hypothetical protein
MSLLAQGTLRCEGWVAPPDLDMVEKAIPEPNVTTVIFQYIDRGIDNFEIFGDFIQKKYPNLLNLWVDQNYTGIDSNGEMRQMYERLKLNSLVLGVSQNGIDYSQWQDVVPSETGLIYLFSRDDETDFTTIGKQLQTDAEWYVFCCMFAGSTSNLTPAEGLDHCGSPQWDGDANLPEKNDTKYVHAKNAILAGSACAYYSQTLIPGNVRTNIPELLSHEKDICQWHRDAGLIGQIPKYLWNNKDKDKWLRVHPTDINGEPASDIRYRLQTNPSLLDHLDEDKMPYISSLSPPVKLYMINKGTLERTPELTRELVRYGCYTLLDLPLAERPLYYSDALQKVPASMDVLSVIPVEDQSIELLKDFGNNPNFVSSIRNAATRQHFQGQPQILTDYVYLDHEERKRFKAAASFEALCDFINVRRN